MAADPTLGLWYLLGGPDGRTPTPCDSYTDPRWVRQDTARDRHWLVGRTDVLPVGMAVRTSFLGRARTGFGCTWFFETVVSAPGHTVLHYQTAYHGTWDEAVEGHEAMVARVRVRLRAEGSYLGAAAPRVVIIGEGRPGRRALARLIEAGVPAADCVAVDASPTPLAPDPAFRCVHLDVGSLPTGGGRPEPDRYPGRSPALTRAAHINGWVRSGPPALPALAEAVRGAECVILLSAVGGAEVPVADAVAALLRPLAFVALAGDAPIRRLVVVGVAVLLLPPDRAGWDAIDLCIAAIRHSVDTLALLRGDRLAAAGGTAAAVAESAVEALVDTARGLLAVLGDPATAEQARAALLRGDAACAGLGRAPLGAAGGAVAQALRSPLLEGMPWRGVHTLLCAVEGAHAGEATAALERLRARVPHAAELQIATRPSSGGAEGRVLALAIGGTELHASVSRLLEEAFEGDWGEREEREAEALAARERAWAATYGPPAREPGEDLGAGELRALLRDAEGQCRADRAVPGGPLRAIVSRHPPIGMGAVRWLGRLSFPLELWIIDEAGIWAASPAEAEAPHAAGDRRPGRREEYDASMSYRITPIAGTPYVLREFQAGPTMGRGDVVRVDRAGGILCIRGVWIS